MGYDLERFDVDIDDIDDCLLCYFCCEVVRDPVMISECKHVYCHECVIEHFEREECCPQDKSAADAKDLVEPERRFFALYNNLMFRCDFEVKIFN